MLDNKHERTVADLWHLSAHLRYPLWLKILSSTVLFSCRVRYKLLPQDRWIAGFPELHRIQERDARVLRSAVRIMIQKDTAMGRGRQQKNPKVRMPRPGHGTTTESN